MPRKIMGVKRAASVNVPGATDQPIIVKHLSINKRSFKSVSYMLKMYVTAMLRTQLPCQLYISVSCSRTADAVNSLPHIALSLAHLSRRLKLPDSSKMLSMSHLR